MADSKDITLKIDDRDVTVPPGTLVIEAARRMGIEVPSFCYFPGLSLQAACRMCLVEVEKAPKLQTACTLVAMPGMVVRTSTPQVHEARKGMLEFLLANHPLDCPVCDKGGECELQDMVFSYGADKSRFNEEKRHQPEQKWSDAVYYDAPRCILCFRCVRVCDEGMDVKALGVGQRGSQSTIIPNGEDHLDCEECGMCIDICPVGALTSGTYRYKTRPWEMTYVSTVCTHCSNGCKTTLSVRNNEILRANNRDLSGINKDFLCAKGRFGFDFTRHAERLKLPLVRREGKLVPSSWEDALAEVSRRLAEVHKANGADSIGFIGSNRTTNEENYLLGRIARASVGTNNIDHHRTADYASLIAALGSGAGTASASMEQLYQADAVLLVGHDPTEQSPLVAWQIRSAIRHRGARLYVINSKSIRLLRKARSFVEVPAGREPSAVRWLAGGEAQLDEGTIARLGVLKAALEKEQNVVIAFGAELTGAGIRDIAKFGYMLPGNTRYIALGDYANSRGAADMGLLPDMLPGYVPLADARAREKFSALWGAKLPEKPGLNARGMLAAAAKGDLHALYVVGANPVKTFGVSATGKLGKLDLLIVQDLFLTETAQLADIVLPAASAYEKNGTMTNTAGEVQLVRKGGDTMGTRSDFDILRILSYQLAQHGLGKAIPQRTPDAVFEEIRLSVKGYDLAMAALLLGEAERTTPVSSVNGNANFDVPAGTIFSSRDTLFTSGSLTRYCTMIQSLPEAAEDAVEVEARP
ncbi:MAG TPA: NADH-quinone oxidoreductase subunit NuoG [Verrucomicrobiae bacterium]|jgi:NADH-quinone oxidoreductase subunit G|nr:NADH-quinone oxidoreductase subunit NuoG [Verrucomicrobiae bacterium]